jgi:2,5-diamino-6-(ribosylamino)-4(3H)-pyrimidinone 5'-phosphate reductase
MRPHVICHSLTSIDGRIQTFRWPLPSASKMFEGPAAQIEVDAWIVGRVTMQEFSSKKARRVRRGTFRIPRTDFVGRHDARTFAVVIDPSGKCNWESNRVDTEHAVEVLTERVSSEYLDHLRTMQVSYIFAGKTSIDLHVALRKLRSLLGIKRARIDGGRHGERAVSEGGLDRRDLARRRARGRWIDADADDVRRRDGARTQVEVSVGEALARGLPLGAVQLVKPTQSRSFFAVARSRSQSSLLRRRFFRPSRGGAHTGSRSPGR